MSRWMMLRVWADSFTSLGNAGPGFAQARTTPPGLKPEYEKMSDVVHGNEIEVYLKDHYAGGIGALGFLTHAIDAQGERRFPSSLPAEMPAWKHAAAFA